jgi:hypothetical protein
MSEFKAWLDPFIWGLVIGYMWHPIWTIAKKIYSEAKKAREEW